jgi:hypothetical protein
LSHPAGEFTLDESPEAITFEVKMTLPDPKKTGMARWTTWEAGRNCLHLRLDAPLEAQIGIKLIADGDPVPEDIVRTPTEGRTLPLDGTPFRVSSLAAGSHQFHPARLEPEFRAYLWYVPPPGVVPLDELDAETIEDMRALGYVE